MEVNKHGSNRNKRIRQVGGKREFTKISGYTTDKKIVVNGILKLIESNGIPLDILLSHFYRNNIIIDWAQLIDECYSIGWKTKKIKEKIEIGIRDSELNKDYKNILTDRINLYLKEKNNNE